MIRIVLLLSVLFAGCTSKDVPLPKDAEACEPGAWPSSSCTGSDVCFYLDQFDGCDSCLMRCDDGVYTCTRGIVDGAGDCEDFPLSSCYDERRPECDVSSTCTCGDDGTWSCYLQLPCDDAGL